MKSAALEASSKFIFIASFTRSRIRSIDPNGVQIFLSPEAPDKDLGRAAKRCLSMSREVSADEIKRIIENSSAMELEWGRSTAKRFGYRSWRALYKELSTCDIKELESSIRIEPSNHSSLREWNDKGLSKYDWVVIDNHASDAALGVACRLALSRCTSELGSDANL
jgi:hypothetical protein